MLKSISTLTLKELILKNEPVLLLDVREQFEYESGHIANAILIPLHELMHRLEELTLYKTKKIIAYCKAGVRSQIACNLLLKNNFTEVYNLEGGFIAWEKLS